MALLCAELKNREFAAAKETALPSARGSLRAPDGCAHGDSAPERDARTRMNNAHAWKHATKRAAMLPGCGAVLPPGKKVSEVLLNCLKGG